MKAHVAFVLQNLFLLYAITSIRLEAQLYDEP